MTIQTRDKATKKPDPAEVKGIVSEFMRRARAAQKSIEGYSQEQADALVTAVGWHVFNNREALAKLAVDEGGFGNVQDKIAKFENRVLGTLTDMAAIKTCGVVEVDALKGLVKIAKPVGVIVALIPTTGPDATPAVKGLAALKARNAIIVAPHPRTRKTSTAVVAAMRRGCEDVGAPADLIQVIENPSITITEELMRQADLIVATGGVGMVHAAYSSGTPAYGVGVGNAVHVVDETADLDDAALMIAKAKTFDYATSCLADNAVIAQAGIYKSLLEKLEAAGGYLCSAEEKHKLQKAMWPDGGHIPTIEVVARSADHVAALAGIKIAPDRRFLIVEENGVGHKHPFSGEKLSVVLALYKYEGAIQAAVDRVNAITAYQGAGHTCGIHTRNDAHVDALAYGTKTARVIVNQNLNEGAGSPRNGMPYTLSLACGTWGGNITTENVNVRHFMNLTWVSRPVAPRQILPEVVFAKHWERYGR
jgi:sulfoacetaldehyde dehydrogenase